MRLRISHIEKPSGTICRRGPIVRSMLTDTTLREAFSHFPQGVVLLAAEIDGSRHALIVSTFTAGVSLDPPLVSVALQHSSRTWPLLRHRPRLGVSLLRRGQAAIARQLASPERHARFAGLDVAVDPEGAVTLRNVPVSMTTSLHGEMPAGDHDLALLEVHSIDSVPGAEAMVFHRSMFRGLGDRDLNG